MLSKYFFLLLFSLMFSLNISAQTNEARFSLGIESQFLLAGELNASFDFLAGVRGNYFFLSNKKFKPFLSLGLATDIGKTNARMISTDIQLGTHWYFSKRFSLLMSLGGRYINESHAHLLIERKDIWSNNLFGITGKFGVDYKILKNLSTTLSFNQTNLNFSSIGLGLNYSF